MKLTDRYVTLARRLSESGYVWNPRPGDWMLDTNDESIGMITTFIQRPELLQKNNFHLPYGEQIASMLDEAGVSCQGTLDEWIWSDASGKECYRCTAQARSENEDEEMLAALVSVFERRGSSDK